jgi:hypothetical protein
LGDAMDNQMVFLVLIEQVFVLFPKPRIDTDNMLSIVLKNDLNNVLNAVIRLEKVRLFLVKF